MPCYKFGHFRYDSSTGVIQSPGTETTLRAKNAQLLNIMLSSDNKVIAKEELYSQLWGDSVVQENSLSKLFNELRLALGDSAKNSTYIKTWPKKGYQFVADVELHTHSNMRAKVVSIAAIIFILVSIFATYQIIINTDDELEITSREFFLLGMDYQRRSEDKIFHLKALEQYKKAVQKNPEYAQAWAQLSVVHSMLYTKAFDKTKDRAKLAQQAAIKALQLEPNLAMAHYAMAQWHYRIERDHDAALKEIDIAQSDPALSNTLQLMRAAILRRKGDYPGAIRIMEELLIISPRVPGLVTTLGTTYLITKDYQRAIITLDKAILFRKELSQDTARLDYRKALAIYLDRGEIQPLLESVTTMDLPANQSHLIAFSIFDPAYQKLIQATASGPNHLFENQNQIYPAALLKAISLHIENKNLALKQQLLKNAETQLLNQYQVNKDARVEIALATIYALTARKELSYQSIQRALELMPANKDATGRMYIELAILQISALTKNALSYDKLQQKLLLTPSLYSKAWKTADPIWRLMANSKD